MSSLSLPPPSSLPRRRGSPATAPRSTQVAPPSRAAGTHPFPRAAPACGPRCPVSGFRRPSQAANRRGGRMDEGLPGTAPAHLGNFAQEMAWGGGCGSPPTGKWRWVEHGWPGGLWQGPNPACSWGSETPEALPGAQRRKDGAGGGGGSRHHTRAHPSSVRTLKAQASHCPGFGWPGPCDGEDWDPCV